jgi:hypothetical protein
VVECLVANENVVGSNPISRSMEERDWEREYNELLAMIEECADPELLARLAEIDEFLKKWDEIDRILEVCRNLRVTECGALEYRGCGGTITTIACA